MFTKLMLEIVLKYFLKSKVLCHLENDQLVVKRAFEEDELIEKCWNGVSQKKVLKS